MPISVHPKAVTDLKKVLYSPLTIVKYFEKGQPHACDYCMHKTARICPDICWVFLRQWAKYEVPPPSSFTIYIEISTHTPICNWEGSNYALGNSRESFSSGNFVELCYTPRKFQDQKPRPMEFAHEFFYITPGNSTSHLIDTWNFHMLFLQYPWKIQVFIQPACFDFLGE